MGCTGVGVEAVHAYWQVDGWWMDYALEYIERFLFRRPLILLKLNRKLKKLFFIKIDNFYKNKINFY